MIIIIDKKSYQCEKANVIIDENIILPEDIQNGKKVILKVISNEKITKTNECRIEIKSTYINSSEENVISVFQKCIQIDSLCIGNGFTEFVFEVKPDKNHNYWFQYIE